MKNLLTHLCLVFALSPVSSPVLADESLSKNIHINQVGYLPSHPKIAFVSSPLGLPFQVINRESEKVVQKGMLTLNEANDPASGSHIWQADFTSLQSPGTYQIHIPGVGSSYPFAIKPGAYQSLSNNTLKTFYHLRSGIAIEDRFSAGTGRKATHLEDALLYSGNPNDATNITVSGGWYDGSDTGKYVINGAFAAGTLLLLHEFLPDHFPDQTLNIPGSGNNVPDILDEARWEISWILKMQRDDGGVYHKVTPLEPQLGVSPGEDSSKRYIFKPSTTATASACALFAKASRLYEVHDATFAQRCFSAAQQAWDFLEQHKEPLIFENPDNVRTEAYTDNDDSDERFWAAIELYLATDDPRYANLASVIADRRIPLLSSSGYWGNLMPLAAGTIIKNVTNENELTILSEVKSDLVTLAQSIQQRIITDGYRLSIQENNFTWGSNSSILQNAIVLILASRADTKAGFARGALDQLHYILGRNPLSRCYVTGHGKNPPLQPHNLNAVLPVKEGQIIPGFLVGGANSNLNDSVLKSTIPGDSPPALAYVDHQDSFSSNETSISWNAALVFVSSFFTRPPLAETVDTAQAGEATKAAESSNTQAD